MLIEQFPFYTEYEARKGCYPQEEAEADLQALKSAAPTWFEFRAGFTFLWTESPSVLLGPGTVATYELNTRHSFYVHTGYEKGVRFMFLYKGQWCHHLLKPEHFEDITPVETTT